MIFTTRCKESCVSVELMHVAAETRWDDVINREFEQPPYGILEKSAATRDGYITLDFPIIMV